MTSQDEVFKHLRSNSPLCNAVIDGHLNAVTTFLDHENANVADDSGLRALHYACISGHAAIAKLLIENKAVANSADIKGETPLHLACISGHAAIAKLLIENKAVANSADIKGETPLHLACISGHADIAKLLIENKADVNCVSGDVNSPLQLASSRGHTDIVTLLLDHGAVANSADIKGAAQSGGNTDIVKLPPEHKPDVNTANSKDAPISAEGIKSLVDIPEVESKHVDYKNPATRDSTHSQQPEQLADHRFSYIHAVNVLEKEPLLQANENLFSKSKQGVNFTPFRWRHHEDQDHYLKNHKLPVETPKYLSRVVTTTSQHARYEMMISMRLLQVLEEKNEEFYFANNMDKLGAFSDVVCKQIVKNKKVKFLFMTLKHAINDHQIITLKESETGSKKNVLNPLVLENIVKKCYSSFLEVYQLIQKESHEMQKFFSQFSDGNFEFVYFTVRNVSEDAMINLKLIEDSSVSEILQSVLSDGGTCLKLSPYGELIDFQKICQEVHTPKNSNLGFEDMFFKFTKQFRFCVSQMSVEKVEILINKNLPSYKKELVVSWVERKLNSWNSEFGDVNFLTLHDQLFNTAMLTLYASEHCVVLPSSHINFKDEYLTELIQKKIVCLTFTQQDKLLGEILISNLLQHLDATDEPLVFDTSIELSLLQYTLRPKCCLLKHIFVIIDSIPEHKDLFFEILQQYSEQEHKFLFLLINEDCHQQLKTQSFIPLPIEFQFDQLTRNSQQQILDTDVNFQSVEVKFDKLFSGTDIVNNASIISQIAERRSVKVGKKLEDLESYYVPRLFITDNISTFVLFLKQNRSSDIHLIINKTLTNETIDHVESNCQIITSENDFTDVCNNSPDTTVHLFQANKSSIIYIKSRGSREHLDRLLIVKENCDVMIREEVLLEKSLSDNRYITIADIPGSGKSKTLLQLAVKLKKLFSHVFVVTVNLNSIKENLGNYEHFNSDSAIKFICDNVLMCNNFEVFIFHTFCYLNRKVILLIDAFDEIVPTYLELVTSFIESLKNTKIENIIITTQPHCRETLQKLLPGPVFLMAKYDQQMLQNYLQKVWQHKLDEENIEIDSAILLTCAERCANVLNDSQLNETAAIPLLLKIFSDVHYSKVKACIETGTKLEIELKPLSTYKLCTEYFEDKLNILVKEKLKISEEVSFHFYKENIRLNSMKFHQLIAVQELLPSSDVDKFFNFRPAMIEPDRLGLLVKSGSSYKFICEMFAKYFLATICLEVMISHGDTPLRSYIENLLKNPKHCHVKKIYDQGGS